MEKKQTTFIFKCTYPDKDCREYRLCPRQIQRKYNTKCVINKTRVSLKNTNPTIKHDVPTNIKINNILLFRLQCLCK